MEAERLESAFDYWPDTAAEEEPAKASRSVAVLRAVHYPLPVPANVTGESLEEGAYLRRWKRALDLALGVPLFLAALPVIALAVAGVAVTMGWPAFYKTKRVGLHGREFTMWKIRSMVKDADEVLATWAISHPELAAEYEANFKLKDDPRITFIGRFLRRTSLDELPQFWNVLRGDMSLVGPRPYFSWELAIHPATWEAITRVRPGVTGPWQVAGRNELTPAERMFLDRTYVHTCRPGIDLGLLIKTVRALAKPDGY